MGSAAEYVVFIVLSENCTLNLPFQGMKKICKSYLDF